MCDFIYNDYVNRGHIFYIINVEKRQEVSGTNKLTFSKMQFVEFAAVDRSSSKIQSSKSPISADDQEINRSLLALGGGVNYKVTVANILIYILF